METARDNTSFRSIETVAFVLEIGCEHFFGRDNIVIKAQPRQGWAEAAKRAHENGDDELLIPDVFEDEKFEDWTW